MYHYLIKLKIYYKLSNYYILKGSSGSPIILLLRNFKIIGIHKGVNNKLKYNRGIYMKYILEDINKKIFILIEDIDKWELR